MGIIGITFNKVVRYIDVTPVIPVATVRSRINLFDLTYFPSFTLKRRSQRRKQHNAFPRMQNQKLKLTMVKDDLDINTKINN